VIVGTVIVIMLMCMIVPVMFVVAILSMFVMTFFAVFMIVVIVMMMTVFMIVIVRVSVHHARFTPETDGANDNQHQYSDAADEHRDVELFGEHEIEPATVVHQDRHGAEEPDDENGEQLLHEIIARRFVMMMIVSHDRLPWNYPGIPVQ
jgi:hypothetical protein